MTDTATIPLDALCALPAPPRRRRRRGRSLSREILDGGLRLATAVDSLIEYAKLVQSDYEAGWVHKEIAENIEQFTDDVIAQRSPRLAITLPPRAGKSRLGVELYVSWLLGKYPQLDTIVTGYGLDIARQRSREAREIVTDEVYEDIPFLTSYRLSADTATKTDWRTESGGGCRAAGVDGPITGHGAHVLIIDDPIKTLKDAMNPRKRGALWDWFRAVAYTRLAPGGGILIVTTRWHEDDLIGRIQDNEKAEDFQGPRFKIINYPAIAIEDEAHRKEGEALHPERFNIKQLLDIKRTLGEHLFNTLYQGWPSLSTESAWPLELFKLYDKLPDRFDAIVISGDLSFGSKSDTASYVSWQVWGDLEDEAYLIAESRARWTFPEARAALIELASRYPPDVLLIEAAANGWALVQEIEHDPRLLDMLGCPHVESVKTGSSSKVARAVARSPRIRRGLVHIPNPEIFKWVEDWIKEVTTFPAATNDDRIDSAGQAIEYITVLPEYIPYIG